jgi:tetratricopeptide (TPR) repeat protein
MCPPDKVIPPDETEAAHAKYVAGRVDYDEGNYDSAINRFKEAYAKDCTKHEVLIIISRAYEQKGDRAKAIEALDTFLKRVPATYADRETYEKRLKRLREDYAKEPKPAPSASAPGTAPAPTASSTVTPPPREAPRGHTAYPWILTGAGVAAVIAGSIVVATAPKNPDNCDADREKCTQLPGESDSAFEEDQNKAGKAKSQPIVGYGIIAGGAAAVVGGLVWFFLEPTGPRSAAATRVSPRLGPTFAGLSLDAPF